MLSRGALALTAGLLLAAAPGAAQLALELAPVATELTRPLAATHAGDGSGRLFIAEQGGSIWIHDGAGVLATPFLELALPLVGGERGLLGLAFHPDYANNGFFYVAHTDADGATVVARYAVSAADPDVADPASRLLILEIEQPFGNHNGGNLAFGPDGYLYVGSGDGGSGGDPLDAGQNLGTLLGKILRIDVDAVAPPLEYAIPPDNPFAGVAGARDEIWAWGLRNPWRFSFDRLTGDLFIGDVGQSAREEIDFQPAASSGGQNYGWRRMEGSACFNPPSDCNDGTLTLPVIDYTHAEGCSVTGGYRYRGAAHPRLAGVYLYGDYCAGTVWGTVPRCDDVWEVRPLLASGLGIGSFGEDEAGELYVLHTATSQGAVYRIGLAADSGGALVVPSPPAVEFGALPLNTVERREVEILNNHPGPEAALVAAITPSDPVSYTLDLGGGSAPCGSPTPCLPPGAWCTLEIEFSSASPGSFDAELTVEGNFAPVGVDLQATVWAECPVAETLDLVGVRVEDAQLFEACFWVSTGPGFEVTATGSAHLVSGHKVVMGNDTVVAGEMTVELDPSIVQP